MKKALVLIGTLLVFAFSFTAMPQASACDKKDCQCAKKDCGCAKHAAQQKGDEKAPVAFDKAPAVGTKATCPVCNALIEVKADTARSEYKGKHYVFCCSGCKTKFDSEPEKYLKK